MLTTCLRRDELSDLVLGKLPPDETASKSEHLEACPQCQAELGSLDIAGDELLAAVQHGDVPSLFEQEPALSRAIAKIKQFGISPAGEPARPPSQLPGDLGSIRDYRLLSKLGQGGMGTVYKALHTQLDKLVALKVLPADRLHAEAVARFKREMKAVGKLHHANIVQAFDAGEHEGTHFLVMELVEGSDLSHVVRNRGPLPVADACELVRQTAVALQYVYEHGMVHRDIKPSNLMLSTAGEVKVLDLGLALLHDPAHEREELTASSAAMGTADYVAPEQTGDSHGVDIRADIYSLGCTFYKLLTGHAPFIGPLLKTPVQKMMAHVGQPFPDVCAMRPAVPERLKLVLDRLVAKDPAGRFATPGEVAAALAPFCAGHNLRALASGDSPAKEAIGGRHTPAPLGTEETLPNSPTQIAGAAAASPDLIPAAHAQPLSVPSRPARGLRIMFAVAACGLALVLLGVAGNRVYQGIQKPAQVPTTLPRQLPATFSVVNTILTVPYSAPTAVAVGDFNEDGKQDLVTANANGSNTIRGVSVYLGDGAGGFGPPAQFGSGENPAISVAVGDFNKDAHLDIVFGRGDIVSGSHDGADLTTLLLGNGDGTFATPLLVAAGLNPFSIAVGDFNGDAKLDLAVTNSDTPLLGSLNVGILLGNGNGTFGPRVGYTAGYTVSSVAVGDFNADHILDLAVADPAGNQFSLLKGKGDGSFHSPMYYAAGGENYGSRSVATGDFNQDGNLDVAVAYSYAQVVVVHAGNGNGTFGSAVFFPVGGKPNAVVAGDFNGDGHPDLVTANHEKSTENNRGASLLMGTGAAGNIGSGSFLPAETYKVGNLPQALAVDDFNKDGIDDVVVANTHSEPSSLSILVGASRSAR